MATARIKDGKWLVPTKWVIIDTKDNSVAKRFSSEESAIKYLKDSVTKWGAPKDRFKIVSKTGNTTVSELHYGDL